MGWFNDTVDTTSAPGMDPMDLEHYNGTYRGTWNRAVGSMVAPGRPKHHWGATPLRVAGLPEDEQPQIVKGPTTRA